MDIVTGALGSVLSSKLDEFLKDEYNLQAGVREKITSLSRELESMHAALRKVAEVPPKELDEQVKLWARDARELSYTVEDILDEFMVRFDAGRKRKDPDMKWYQHVANKILEVFSQAKARREISGMIDTINKKAREVATRRERYRVDNSVAKPAAKNTIDPRLKLMYREVTQLVGIEKSRAELMSMLQADDVSSENMVRMVSIVGAGGLGKTTLAKVSYDELKSSYDCSAFVSVGQNPDFLKVFKDILHNLDKTNYKEIHNTGRGVDLLISELQEFLDNKRYFIVIDDIWEPESWDTIKVPLDGNNCGSRIIMTTHKLEVANEAGAVYKLQPLSDNNSKRLFYTRLFGGEDKCPNNHSDELSAQILKKCGGVPLAIITMASLLLGKSREEWIEVSSSPGFYRDKDERRMENTIHILSLSYYDLPSHLKTCLLYLSVFPEDTHIDKDSLISMWIAEGFVEKKQRRWSFKVGEEYFHDLINRSLIQGVDSEGYGIMDGCRVHDMVLDLIRSKSKEENFVSDNGTLSESKARRLALKNRELDLTQDTPVTLPQPQVRSFIILQCVIAKWGLHPRLKLIRVLALEGCEFREGCDSLEHIGNLIHLRYLGIRYTGITELPEGIGALKFLHTVHLEHTRIIEKLPCSIGMLTQLVCLRAPEISAPGGVICRLTSLEELQIAGPDNNGESWRQFVKDLVHLRELRVLKINSAHLRLSHWEMDEGTQKDLVQSIGNLKKMQHLTLLYLVYAYMNVWHAAVPPRDLRCLFLQDVYFPKLPSWINSAHLPSLSHLEINVEDLDDQGLQALGGFPELCYLRLETNSGATVTSNSTVADGCFQKLRSLVLPDSMVQFVANEDSSASFTICFNFGRLAFVGLTRNNDNCRVVPGVVMPNLEELEFRVPVKQLMQNSISCEDIGLEYLPSIRKVKTDVYCYGVYKDDVEREETALRHAIQVHPNRPTLQIDYSFD